MLTKAERLSCVLIFANGAALFNWARIKELAEREGAPKDMPIIMGCSAEQYYARAQAEPDD